MTLPWLVVGLYVVFWASEWPRRAFSAEGCPLSPAQMVDPRERLWSWLYYPLAFVFGFALLLSGWFLTRKLAPELLVVFLSPIIPLSALRQSRIGSRNSDFVKQAGVPTLHRELFPKQLHQARNGVSLLYMIEWQDVRLTGTRGDLWVEVFGDAQGTLRYVETNWPPAREAAHHLLGP